MPLAISDNLWSGFLQEETVLSAIQAAGYDGIEVTPSRLASWDARDKSAVKAYRQKLDGCGLGVAALRQIAYGRQGVQLLDSDELFERLLEHLRLVAELAQQLGTTRLLFCDPDNRNRGEMEPSYAFRLASERMRVLAEEMRSLGVTLILQPASFLRGGDFLQTMGEAAALVRTVRHAGLRLDLDVGTMIAELEMPEAVIQDNADLLAYIHYADPRLAPVKPLGAMGEELGKHLRRIRYDGWIGIDMKPQPNPMAHIAPSISFAKQIFITEA